MRFRPKKQHPSINVMARLMPCLVREASDQPGAPRNKVHKELLTFLRAGEKHDIQAHALY